MVKLFRGEILSIEDTGSGPRIVQALGRGVRALEDIPMMQHKGLLSMPVSSDAALFAQVDDLVLAIATDSDDRPTAAQGETILYATKECFLRLMPDGSVRVQAKKVVLGTDAEAVPTAGVLTGECLDPITGCPFPDHSSAVFASKVAS